MCRFKAKKTRHSYRSLTFLFTQLTDKAVINICHRNEKYSFMNAIRGASKNDLVYQRDANQYKQCNQSDFNEMIAESFGINRLIEHADIGLKSDYNLEDYSYITEDYTRINEDEDLFREEIFGNLHGAAIEDHQQRAMTNYDSGLQLNADSITLHDSNVAEEEQSIDCLGKNNFVNIEIHENKTFEQIHDENLKISSGAEPEEGESNLAAIDVSNDAETIPHTIECNSGVTQNPQVISFETRPQYECDACGKRFIKFRNFNNHLKTHNLASMYKCTKCDMIYLRAASFKRHMEQFHTTPDQVDTHHCRFCQKYYRSKYALRIHMRFHTGEFPCECSTCGKRFSDNGHLLQHKRVKHQQFRFKCAHESCGKMFETDRALRNHVYEHDKSWPFVCVHCGKGLGTKYNCRTHIAKRHKVNATDDELNAMQQFKPKRISQSHCLKKMPDAKLKNGNNK